MAVVVEEFVTELSYKVNPKGLLDAKKRINTFMRGISREFTKTEAKISISLDQIGAKSLKAIVQLKRFSRSLNQEFLKTSNNIRTLGGDTARFTKSTRTSARAASKSLRQVSTSASQASQKIKTLSNSSTTASKRVRTLNREARKAAVGVDKLGRSSASAGRKAGIGLSARGVGIGLAIVGIRKLTSSFTDVVKTGASFEQQLANLGAITRASTEDMRAMSNLAKDLGENTEFSASQAASGFTELSKLGFSSSQILASASSIVDLATASQTNLGNASMVAASTLRQFGFDASRMREVTDVMSRSFTISALDINNFKSAMKFVGPVANSMGVSLQETTGLLAALSNQGLKGTVAATGLRRVLTDVFDSSSKAGIALKNMGKFSGTATDRLKALRTAGIKGVATKKLFGRVAQTAADVLIRMSDTAKLGKDSIDGLTREILLANGATEEMARKQRDTLQGQLKATTSKFEALKIAIFEAFQGPTRDGVVGFNKTLGETLKWVKENKEFLTGLALAGRNAFRFLISENKLLNASLKFTRFLYGDIFTLVSDLANLAEKQKGTSKNEIEGSFRKVKLESERNKLLKEIGSKQADETKILKGKDALLQASFDRELKRRGGILKADFPKILEAKEDLSKDNQKIKLLEKQAQRFAILNLLRDESIRLTEKQRSALLSQLVVSTEANQQQFETTKKEIQNFKTSGGQGQRFEAENVMQELRDRSSNIGFQPVAPLGAGFTVPPGNTQNVTIKNEINFDARGTNIEDPEALKSLIQSEVSNVQRSNTNTMLKKLSIATRG